MSLNVKNEQVVELVAEVARLTGESKTEAIRRALLERRDRLRRSSGLTAAETSGATRMVRWLSFLESEVWPHVPTSQRGQPVTRSELEAILGIGEDGV